MNLQISGVLEILAPWSDLPLLPGVEGVLRRGRGHGEREPGDPPLFPFPHSLPQSRVIGCPGTGLVGPASEFLKPESPARWYLQHSHPRVESGL